jgi:hypothetical protein
MLVAIKIGAVVFLLQCIVLIGTSALFQVYGGSLEHEISRQDAAHFMGVAKSLLEDGTFRQTGKAVLDTWLTPGYPFFVAGVFALTNHSLNILLVLLAFLGGASSALVYLIARTLDIRPPFSYASALLFGISPAVIWLPASGMGGDMLFVFLLLGATYLTLKLRTTKHWWVLAVSIGLLHGLATLVRPIDFYFFFIWLIAIPFITYATEQTRKRIAITLCLMLLSFYAAIMPWMIRNELVGNHFSLSSQFAHNPFYYNIPLYLAWRDGSTQDAEVSKLMDLVGTHDNYALISGFTHKNPDGQYYYDILAAFDKQFLKENWIPYFAFHLYKTIPFFVGSGVNVVYATITNEIPNMPDVPFFPRAAQNTASLFYGGSYGSVLYNLFYYWPSTLERIAWLMIFILAFAAPLVTSGLQRRFAILGVGMILAIAILASPIAQPRYRIPAEPFIWLLATMTTSLLAAKYHAQVRCA